MGVSDQMNTTFYNDWEYAKHLVDRHRKELPPALLLQKFNVAVQERVKEGVKRWDVNFR